MASSRITTLFSEAPPSGWHPSVFVVSTVLHCLAMGLVVIALKHTSQIIDTSHVQRYTVRLLNMPREEPRVQRASETRTERAAPQATRQQTTGRQITAPETTAQAAAGVGQPAAPPVASVPRQLANLLPAPQTLVQPDVPPDLLIPQETPIPLVVLWAPEDIPVKNIVPAPPQKTATPNIRPSFEWPNHEPTLADLRISSTPFPAQMPSLPPSTTSPIVILKPTQLSQVPETSSPGSGQPTPVMVMSISDLRLQQGTVAMPLVNETAAAASSDALAPGRPGSSAQMGSGNLAGKQQGIGTVQGSGDSGSGDGNSKAAAGKDPVGQNGANTATNADAGSSNGPAVDRINLPKDGHFGVVVVGSSPSDEYPDAPAIWASRLAYTVYLHIGAAKNWILQYSLPRVVEAAAVNGTRPDAPWPYLIVRPHLAPGDFNADAVMVHGFVDVAGHFEHLAVVFPQQFAQTKFLLSALQQWQFRPAIQNGQMTSVEVLLIIPDEQE